MAFDWREDRRVLDKILSDMKVEKEGEEVAKAAKEEAMKINLKRDIRLALDKIEALKAEVEGLKGELQDAVRSRDWFKGHARFWKGEARVAAEQLDAYKAQRDELAAQIDAVEKRSDGGYDLACRLGDENDELRADLRRMVAVAADLAAIVAGREESKTRFVKGE